MLTRPSIGIAAVTENLLRHRWAAEILRHLGNGASESAEISKLEPALPSSVMNSHLRKLLRHDLITRHPKLTPTRVIEYKLTVRGRKVLKMLTLIAHLDELPEEDEVLLERVFPIKSPLPSEKKSPAQGKARPKAQSEQRHPAAN